MTYGELKQVLGDRVTEITLTSDSKLIVTYELNKLSGEERLLNDIFGNDPISDLNGFEVKKVYSLNNGFALEFEYNLNISKIVSNNANLKLVEFIDE